jgi:uncharacterized protein (TIGR03437 family)
MRKVHYIIKLLVCFALTWVSLTMAVSRLDSSTGRSTASAASRVPAGGSTASDLFQTQPQGAFYPAGGPTGGTVNALLSVSGGALAATNGGVYYTMDNGETWAARNNGLTNLSVNTLVLVGAVVYAGTLGGVFQSNNNGLSWSPLNLGLTVLAVLALSYIGSTLYAGTSGGGLFAFINGQWTQRNNGLTDLRVNAIMAIGAFIFLGTLGGVFRSDNGGSSWSPVNVGLTALAVTALIFIGATLFAGTQGGGVFRSTNNGGSWSPVNTGLTNLFILSFFVIGATLLVGTRAGLFRSTNDGGAWTPLGLAGLTAITIRAILIVGALYFIGALGGGVFVSTDQGQSWNEKNRGLAAAEVRALGVARRPNCTGFAAQTQTCEDVYAVTLGGIFRSSDNGRSWTSVITGLDVPAARQGTAFLATSTDLYCGTNDGGYRMPIGGTAWIKMPGLTDAPLTFAAAEPALFIGTANGAYRSIDRGQTWTPINTGLTNRQVLKLTTADGKVYAATNGGGVSELVGDTWQQRNDGLTNLQVSAIGAVTARDGTTGMLGGLVNGEIYKNKIPLLGSLWRQTGTSPTRKQLLVFISPRIINPQFSPIAQSNSEAEMASETQAQQQQFVLAGTLGDGALISTDAGESWAPFNNGLFTPNVFDFAVVNNQLLAATGGGVYFFAAPVASVSAASFSGAELAAESIVAAFGPNLANTTQTASATPLPTTLAGAQVKVRDSAGRERDSALFFVSPTQANYQMPPGTATGPATVSVTRSGAAIALGMVNIVAVAPGLFSANSSGQGVAAGAVLRVKADGTQSFEPIAQFDPAQNRFVALPIDLGPETDQVFLILFGTGLRFRSALSSVSARIGGANVETLYAGEQNTFVGLDQINLRLSRALAGRGELEVAITVDGKSANTLRISIR